MAPVGITALSLPFLLIFSSLAAVPLAGPPLPLDPALSAIAPRDCLWYASSAGVAEPDASSTNQTEQLFAEPEVRYCASEIQKQLIGALRRGAGSRREQRVLAAEIPKLIQALLSRPLAAFVEDFQIADDGFDAQAALVLNAGEQRPAIEAAIGELVALAMKNDVVIGSTQSDGETWSVVRVSMQTPEIRWGWHDNYFILAVGDGTVETIIDRLTGDAPAWLDNVRNEHPIERESSLGYVNVEMLLERLQPLLEKQKGWHVVEKLGLTSIKSLNGLSGFDEQGCVAMSQLVTDGRRRGLLSLLPYKELSDNDLKLIPQDVMVACAVRIDLSETWKNVVRLVEEFDPKTAEKMERSLWEAETELGVNLKDDVLGSLGDVWTAYVPTGDLMTSWHGSAVACKVKDADRLRTAMKKLVAVAQANFPAGRRGGVKIRDTEFERQTIYSLNVVGTPFPFSPAWCVTDDWLVLGLTPQTVRGMITRRQKESLADVPEVRQMFDHAEAPTSLTYVDTPKLARSLYPLVQMGLQMLSSQLAREGIEIDTSILPSPDAIIRHLRPSVSTMTSSNNGLVCYSQHSLPGGGGAVVLAPLAVGVTLPAVQAARMAARRNQGLNNMKQIALAFHNYESANGKFPTNIYDDDGKALLSWRVRLLPYFEQQQALYEKFQLNEPWDSPHNRPLADTVVQVYSSPVDPANGKTRYLALAGKETIFPGNEKLSFRHVQDGTSNTIMFVEASRDAAVVWTRPKDLEFDAKKPFQGIKSPQGLFSVAFADGSCRSLSQFIGEDTMRALATRAGGEIIDHSALQR
ncbi:MAG: DUF1559 domain-containing protein [Planctomycetes bacterium]|nr:DUF1559 domain-containing protein [Planctomycetota bacterium]